MERYPAHSKELNLLSPHPGDLQLNGNVFPLVNPYGNSRAVPCMLLSVSKGGLSSQERVLPIGRHYRVRGVAGLVLDF